MICRTLLIGCPIGTRGLGPRVRAACTLEGGDDWNDVISELKAIVLVFRTTYGALVRLDYPLDSRPPVGETNPWTEIR